MSRIKIPSVDPFTGNPITKWQGNLFRLTEGKRDITIKWLMRYLGPSEWNAERARDHAYIAEWLRLHGWDRHAAPRGGRQAPFYRNAAIKEKTRPKRQYKPGWIATPDGPKWVGLKNPERTLTRAIDKALGAEMSDAARAILLRARDAVAKK